MALKLSRLEGGLQLFEEIDECLVFHELLRSKEGHVIGRGFIDVVVVIVEHIHSFQILGGDYLFL